MSRIPIVRTVAELSARIAEWRSAGLRVGYVPTMGALHEGHLSLVRLVKTKSDRAIASIFINPRQFAAHEDLDRYPRDEDGDADKLAEAGCDLIFAPNRAEMYPEGFSTAVSVSGVSAPLEGEARPHFFGGVATVVAKLLLQALPDVAAFGEKDYQQLLVIKRMARDLNIPTEIVGGATVREADGLAMSSRNAYLTSQERMVASQLNVVLRETIAALRAGGTVADAQRNATERLMKLGFSPVDYVAVRDAETLEALPNGPLTKPARILAAAWLGKTRLIDNMAV